MFTAQHFMKYTVETASECALRCFTEQPCIAFNYNTSSHECGLLDRNIGKVAIEDHTAGVRGELISTFEPTVPVVNCSSDIYITLHTYATSERHFRSIISQQKWRRTIGQQKCAPIYTHVLTILSIYLLTELE